tara:strand:- start:414 stop:2159 length:1746 start_codon:yes stop_codon:yes gene_type:complete
MRKFYNNFYLIIFLSLLFHICASYFSTGWLNADEQSCVLEYVNLKLGYSSNPCFLTYKEGIVDSNSSIKLRSFSQPYLYYVIAKILMFFDLKNFIIITFLFKLISSFLGWLSILFFYNLTKNEFKNILIKDLYLILIFLFWFYPLLHARTSAENLSITFFLFGISFYLYFKNNINFYKSLIIASCLSISFVFRYNIIFCIIFFYIWILIFENISLRNKIQLILYSSLSGLIILILEFLINIWGFYNEINLQKIIFDINFLIKESPLVQLFFYFEGNNYYSNNHWSKHSIFGYIKIILFKFYPPLSLLVLLSLCYITIKNYKHLLVWIIIPYFLIHSFIPHKELRYVFPILIFSPYLICYFLDKVQFLKKYLNQISKILITLNIFPLLFFSFTSLRPELNVLNELYYSDIKKIFYINSDETIKDYESINPFELDLITDNYYFKFLDVEVKKRNNNKIKKIGSCRSEKHGRRICLKKQINIFNDYNNNLISLNFIKNDLKKSNLSAEIINLNENLDIKSLLEKYHLKETYYILTKDIIIIKSFINNNKCNVVKSSTPIWFSKIKLNNINKRIDFLVLFKCNSI